MDQISEHQRDLTNSASSRFVPELLTGFCYALMRTNDALSKILPNERRMDENLAVSKRHVVAEPLYIILALHGYPDAYDTVMRLSRESRKTGITLMELAGRKPELAPYFEKLTPREREILGDPAKYTGAAAERTAAVCAHWKPVCDGLAGALEIERRTLRAAPLRNAL
jgi:adenylosuccinate lyase